jgi:hypothetical protein
VKQVAVQILIVIGPPLVIAQEDLAHGLAVMEELLRSI